MSPAPTALLDADDARRLREALLRARYTVEGTTDRLGPVGEAALTRGDLAGVRRHLRGDDAVAVLARLFLTGAAEPVHDVAPALAPLPVPAAVAAGLLRPDGDATLRAALDLRPHGSDLSPDPWWVLSDLGSDVRPGPLAPDHVLGVGPAAASLAAVTVRRPVSRALDVGTGCGVQALHLSAHAGDVVATDLSRRALRFAATSWALSCPGRPLPLRRGSLLEPVAGERFDQVVANPPFVVSPAAVPGFTYRDGGREGDALCRELVGGLGDVLAPGGTAQVLVNWLVTADGPWEERVRSWLPPGCDAWVWNRETADLGEYAALWLRDAGDGPDRPGWAARYDAWVDGLQALGAVAVGMGSAHLVRRDVADPTVVVEDVPQPLVPPVGPAVAGWFDRAEWLRSHGRDDDLRRARLVVAADLERVVRSVAGPDGWAEAALALRQRSGLAWEVEVDAAVAALVGALDGTRPLGLVLDLLALGRDDVGGADRLAVQGPAVVRDLVARGLLEPAP